MRTTYQRAFDHVTASDHLKKEVLEMTKQEQDILRRRIPRAVLIAAVLILVLAGTAVAVTAAAEPELTYQLLLSVGSLYPPLEEGLEKA